MATFSPRFNSAILSRGHYSPNVRFTGDVSPSSEHAKSGDTFSSNRDSSGQARNELSGGNFQIKGSKFSDKNSLPNYYRDLLGSLPPPSKFFQNFREENSKYSKFYDQVKKLKDDLSRLKLLQLPNIAESLLLRETVVRNLSYSTRECYQLSQTVFPPRNMSQYREDMLKNAVSRNLEVHEACFTREYGGDADSISRLDAKSLDGKRVLLVGGGIGPIQQELTNRNIDCEVTSIDPIFTEHHPENARYKIGYPFSHPEVQKVLQQKQFNEIWALWSLPCYARNEHEVFDFYRNTLKALSKNYGILRVGPVYSFGNRLDVSSALSNPYIERLSSHIVITTLRDRPDLFNVELFTTRKYGKNRMATIKPIGDPDKVKEFLDNLEQSVFKKFNA